MTFRQITTDGIGAFTLASQAAPSLQWISIADLVIDGRYQRPLLRGNIAAIRKIAGAFSWARFSPIIVAPVEGGKYAIIDGQHRAHAAAACGIEAVPAMVSLIAPEEQAKAFIEINTSQIKVSGHHLYRAALSAGDAWAIECKRRVEAAGCRLMTSIGAASAKKPGEVYSIGLVMAMIKRGDGLAVTAGLKAMLDCDASAVANFDGNLLTPWLGAVASDQRFLGDGVALAALRSRRPWLVVEAAAAYAKKAGEPVAVAKRLAFVGELRAAVEALA